MSNDVTTSDGGAQTTPPTNRRRTLWVATGVAGLTGVVGLAALGGLAARDNNKSDDPQQVSENRAAAPQYASDDGKDRDKDRDRDLENKDRDKGHEGKDRDKDKDRDERKVREVPCDDDELIEALDLANRDEGGTLKLTPDCTYELDEFDKKSDAGLPTIKQEIKIEGNGATIKRESRDGFRIFRVADGGDLTLKDVTVKNGAAADREHKQVKHTPPAKKKAPGNASGTGAGAEAPAAAPALAAPAKPVADGENDWQGKEEKKDWHGKDDKEHQGDGGGMLVERGGRAHLVNTKFFLNSAENN
ncbi:hypothetical protein C1I95_30235, partial [Micromonospora craterilacus]